MFVFFSNTRQFWGHLIWWNFFWTIVESIRNNYSLIFNFNIVFQPSNEFNDNKCLMILQCFHNTVFISSVYVHSLKPSTKLFSTDSAIKYCHIRGSSTVNLTWALTLYILTFNTTTAPPHPHPTRINAPLIWQQQNISQILWPKLPFDPNYTFYDPIKFGPLVNNNHHPLVVMVKNVISRTSRK